MNAGEKLSEGVGDWVPQIQTFLCIFLYYIQLIKTHEIRDSYQLYNIYITRFVCSLQFLNVTVTAGPNVVTH